MAALWLPGTVTAVDQSTSVGSGAADPRSVPTTTVDDAATLEPSASVLTARISSTVPVARLRKSANTRGWSVSDVPSDV